MPLNPFEEYSRTAIAKPVRKRMARQAARQAKREKTDKEKAIDEKNWLTRQYRKHWKNREQAIIEQNDNPDVMRAIINMVRGTRLSDGKTLVEICKDEWVQAQGQETKFVLLHIINDHICKTRKKAGLDEIYDAIPIDLEPNAKLKVFQKCKILLTSKTPPTP